MFVELTLDPADTGPFEEVRQRLARVRCGLEDRLGGLDLAIRLQPPEAEAHRRAAARSGEDH